MSLAGVPLQAVDPALAPEQADRLSRLLTVARSRRVILLLSAVALVSIADLVMTLLFLTSYGFNEGNPLARAIMSYSSPALVVLWKLASVTACAGIIYRFRAFRCAEIAAWICFGVMIWLSFRWVSYLCFIDSLVASNEDPASLDSATWVTMAAVNLIH